MTSRTCIFWTKDVQCGKPTKAGADLCPEHQAYLDGIYADMAARAAVPERVEAIETLPVIVMNKPKDP